MHTSERGVNIKSIAAVIIVAHVVIDVFAAVIVIDVDVFAREVHSKQKVLSHN